MDEGVKVEEVEGERRVKRGGEGRVRERGDTARSARNKFILHLKCNMGETNLSAMKGGGTKEKGLLFQWGHWRRVRLTQFLPHKLRAIKGGKQ
jgi:hypothetical protein